MQQTIHGHMRTRPITCESYFAFILVILLQVSYRLTHSRAVNVRKVL